LALEAARKSHKAGRLTDTDWLWLTCPKTCFDMCWLDTLFFDSLDFHSMILEVRHFVIARAKPQCGCAAMCCDVLRCVFALHVALFLFVCVSAL
jgi:hypothetical protein